MRVLGAFWPPFFVSMISLISLRSSFPGPPGERALEKVAAQQTKVAAAQLNQNRCAIFGIRTVLAENSTFVCCA
jgi:hypothetical protein